MRNIRLDICYDGTRYYGWQRLPGNKSTIQGKLEETLSRILGEKIEVSGSGRTDAGVHAEGQIANFHTNSSMPCEGILCELRRFLPEDIGILSCREADPRFHARLLAKQKTYRYRIWTSSMPCVFERRFVHVVSEPLDVEAMRRGAALLSGEHDFSCFCANKNMKKSTVRRIDSIEIFPSEKELRIYVTGDGFLYNMVRILVGTLYEVGTGKREVDSLTNLFGKKREEAGILVPAKGLCLMEVQY